MKVHLHQSSNIKSKKEVKKICRNQMFFLLFCLLMEGFGSGFVQIMTDPDPGGPKKSGSTTLPKTEVQLVYILYMIANVANKLSCYICMDNRTDDIFAVNTGGLF